MTLSLLKNEYRIRQIFILKLKPALNWPANVGLASLLLAL